jgi:Anti-sigma factor NepR
MQTDAHIRKVGGRLSREDQRRLGDILQRVYDDVVRQGVPDRFKDLLSELDEDDEPTKAHGDPQGDDRRDHLVKAFPHNKGSS